MSAATTQCSLHISFESTPAIWRAPSKLASPPIESLLGSRIERPVPPRADANSSSMSTDERTSQSSTRTTVRSYRPTFQTRVEKNRWGPQPHDPTPPNRIEQEGLSATGLVLRFFRRMPTDCSMLAPHRRQQPLPWSDLHEFTTRPSRTEPGE